MHAHIIAAATNNVQYATESWSKGGAILGIIVLILVFVALKAVRKAFS